MALIGLPPVRGQVRGLWIAILHLLLAATVCAYTPLSEAALRNVTVSEADFDIHNGPLLAPILIPRVPGTEGQVKTQQHFVNFFKSLPKWTVQWQNSTGKTPATGDRDIPFQNLIIRREPPWTKPGQANYLTLVAHYDSKIEPAGFIGATDSAAPCAMLLHVAKALDPYLTQMYDEMVALGENGGTVPQDMGLQILFLDGEEAFKTWTDTDSLYGARSLSQEWENTFNPAMSHYKNPLEQISLFVLLDLLGSPEPRIPSYFQSTHWAYKAMAAIEKRMRDLGILETKPIIPFLNDVAKASSMFGNSGIGDDHVPFMMKGVNVLHMIPSPFPYWWHKIEDDGEHLDMPTVRDWTRIVTAFVMEWLDAMEVISEDGA
ncbi:peptidase family M28 [Colletotrichum sublineola]|uniref:Peptide hydrolase n=1 Tax=Colletotrichum sublineola TaxID=1173701 RepID=A0A066X8Y8_COLSU|nr:peptidase family M28 [Colletotrichum sublineola]KDN65618.1 putative peptidase family M28 [Colletotrichum sublineola]